MRLIDLIELVRLKLSDTVDPVLWEDEELISFYNIIHTDLYKLLSYRLFGTEDNPYVLRIMENTDLMTNIDNLYLTNPDLLDTLINGMVYLAYSKNDVDTINFTKSIFFKQKYLEGIELWKRKLLKNIRSTINIKSGFL